MSALLYFNGSIMHGHDARISPTDAGFIYGAGMFETMLCMDGRVHAFSRHIARLRQSCAAIGVEIHEKDEDFANAIETLLMKNSLRDGEVRCKIIVSPGDIHEYVRIRRNTTIIVVEPYTRPPLYVAWRLYAGEHVRAGKFTQHKSTSYIECRMALHDARRRGFDDVLLRDRYGNISETSIASLLLRHRGTWIVPETPDALEGIARDVLLAAMKDEGMQSRREVVTLELLFDDCVVVLCNSLLGPIPVGSINAHELPQLSRQMCERLRELWLNRGFTETAKDTSGCS